MAHRNADGRNLRARVGAVLLTVGILLMVGNLGLAAAGLPQFLQSLGIEALGLSSCRCFMMLKFFHTIAFRRPAALFAVSLMGYWYYSFAIAAVTVRASMLLLQALGGERVMTDFDKDSLKDSIRRDDKTGSMTG